MKNVERENELWVIQINEEKLSFFARSVEAEVLLLWESLSVDEIFDLEYLHIDTDTMKEVCISYELTPELRNVIFKNIREILTHCEKPLGLSQLHLTFKNGLLLHYNMGELRFQFDDRDLFYKYSDVILRQHGYIPAYIYTLSKHIPDKVLGVQPPGILIDVLYEEESRTEEVRQL